MEQIYIIGRSGTQPFKITSESVHGEHAKITITDQGVWILEDLKGEKGNGTYIQDQHGEFYRIYRAQITPDTIIRLASGGHWSYTFMAHRVLAAENDFSYEFRKLKKMFKEQVELEKRQESINVRNSWIARCSTIVPYLACPIIEKCTGAQIDVGLRTSLIMVAPILTGLLFRNDASKLKRIKEQRLKTIVCPNPNCKRPLSELDINNMKCSICKAK